VAAAIGTITAPALTAAAAPLPSTPCADLSAEPRHSPRLLPHHPAANHKCHHPCPPPGPAHSWRRARAW
jgi:hypothetical protein